MWHKNSKIDLAIIIFLIGLDLFGWMECYLGQFLVASERKSTQSGKEEKQFKNIYLCPRNTNRLPIARGWNDVTRTPSLDVPQLCLYEFAVIQFLSTWPSLAHSGS